MQGHHITLTGDQVIVEAAKVEEITLLDCYVAAAEFTDSYLQYIGAGHVSDKAFDYALDDLTTPLFIGGTP